MSSPNKLAKYIADLLKELNTAKSDLEKANHKAQKYKDELQKLKGEQPDLKFKKQPPKGNI